MSQECAGGESSVLSTIHLKQQEDSNRSAWGFGRSSVCAYPLRLPHVEFDQHLIFCSCIAIRTHSKMMMLSVKAAWMLVHSYCVDCKHSGRSLINIIIKPQQAQARIKHIYSRNSLHSAAVKLLILYDTQITNVARVYCTVCILYTVHRILLCIA